MVPVKGYISKPSVLSLQSRSKTTSHGWQTPRVTANSLRSGHGQHTPRVTAKSRTRRTGHGQQTPRVTAKNVKIPSSLPRLQYLSHSLQSRSSLTSHGRQTPRVTANLLPVSGFNFLSNKEMNKLIKQQHGNGKNSLIICHWNLGSKKWKNKLNQIQALVDQNNADLIFISEANLDEMTPLHESIISGYNITLPKTVVRNGTARLVLLTKESLQFELRSDLMDDIVSSIWLKISRKGQKSILVCGIYREHQYLKQDSDWSLQPNEQIRRWNTFLRQVETTRLSSTCHIIGDVNLDYNKWSAPDFSQLQMVTDTKNSLEAGGFFQLVSDITRSWPGQVDSTIDHFWTNKPPKIMKITNSIRAVGDHNVITVTVRIKGKDTTKLDTRKRSYKNFDPVIYRQKLELENWDEIYEIDDVDLANDFLESKVVGILDKMCPYKTVQHRTESKNWLTDTTKLKMLTRDVTRERARQSGDQELWSLYKVQRNEVNRLVNSDRKSHFVNLYNRHHENKDVGATYRAAKSQVGMSKNTSPTNFILNGNKILNPQEMADIMMKTFENKTEKLINDLPPPTIDPCAALKVALSGWGKLKEDRKLFDFVEISNMDTLKVLNELGNNSSAANDRMDALALKHGAKILYGPITHIINCSIRTLKFATKWKIGKLLPLHKGKGLDPLDPKLYRPISLLPVIGKITEKILQKQIMNFMESSGQLNNNIHSYRKQHSTVSAMLQLSDEIFRGCNEKKITTLVTLDQSAAFDVIRHETLRNKLQLYNFSESVLKWMDTYLNHRSQYVMIGTRNSKYSNVKSGIPQGSVLGPILYVLYINELPSLTNDANCAEEVHVRNDESLLFTENCGPCGQIPTYADDSTVVITTKNWFEAQERIIILVNRVKDFLTANSMSINLGKSEIVETMVRQKRVTIQGVPPQLSVAKPDGTLKIILAKESCRLLGVNINRDATWSHQLSLGDKPVLKTLRSVLGVLTHVSNYLPMKSKLLLANGLFISRLLYLLPMWGGLPKRDMKTLQIIMNKCARMILGLPRKTRTRALMTGCQWLYFRELVEFHSLVQMFKIVNLGTPVNLRKTLIIDNDKRITTSNGRLKIVKNSFRWRTVSSWNSLPAHLILSGNLSSFKRNLRKFLIDSRVQVVPRKPPDWD